MPNKTFKRKNTKLKSKKTLKRHNKRSSRSSKMRGGMVEFNKSTKFPLKITTNKDLIFNNESITFYFSDGDYDEDSTRKIKTFTIPTNTVLNINKNISLDKFEISFISNLNMFENIREQYASVKLYEIIFILNTQNLYEILKNSDMTQL